MSGTIQTDSIGFVKYPSPPGSTSYANGTGYSFGLCNGGLGLFAYSPTEIFIFTPSAGWSAGIAHNGDTPGQSVCGPLADGQVAWISSVDGSVVFGNILTGTIFKSVSYKFAYSYGFVSWQVPGASSQMLTTTGYWFAELPQYIALAHENDLSGTILLTFISMYTGRPTFMIGLGCVGQLNGTAGSWNYFQNGIELRSSVNYIGATRVTANSCYLPNAIICRGPTQGNNAIQPMFMNGASILAMVPAGPGSFRSFVVTLSTGQTYSDGALEYGIPGGASGDNTGSTFGGFGPWQSVPVGGSVMALRFSHPPQHPPNETKNAIGLVLATASAGQQAAQNLAAVATHANGFGGRQGCLGPNAYASVNLDASSNMISVNYAFFDDLTFGLPYVVPTPTTNFNQRESMLFMVQNQPFIFDFNNELYGLSFIATVSNVYQTWNWQRNRSA